MGKFFKQLLVFVTVFNSVIVCGQINRPMGGELTYSHIGAYDYEVVLIIYQVPDSAVIQSKDVKLTSDCTFPDQTLTMKAFTPTWAAPAAFGGVSISQYNCGDTLIPDSLKPLAFYYRDTVTIGGMCNDFEFSYENCCRDSAINNINQVGGTAMHIHATLNNTISPYNGYYHNTSASIANLNRYVFYKGTSSHSYGGTTDPDNDSLRVWLVAARDSNGNKVSYLPGFSPRKPMKSASSILEKITPLMSGKFTVVYEVEEFRYDLLYSAWLRVGSVMREVTYVVEDSIPDFLESNAFGGAGMVDTLRGIYCNDSVVSFGIDDFFTGSITQDASEFRLIVDSVVIPVAKVVLYNVGPNLICDSVGLKLHKPLTVNDSVIIQLQQGSDGNTLLNACGNEFPDSDSGILIVEGCSTAGLIEKSGSKLFSLYPNPARDKITLEFEVGESPESMTIYNLQGQELKYLVSPSQKTEIDLSEFAKGMYLIKASSGNNYTTQLFQKN